MRSSSIGLNRVLPYSEPSINPIKPAPSSSRQSENKNSGQTSNLYKNQNPRVPKPSGIPRSFNEIFKNSRPATQQISQRHQASSITPLKNKNSIEYLNSKNHKIYFPIDQNPDESICNITENYNISSKVKSSCAKCKKVFKDNLKFLTPKCEDHSYCCLCIEMSCNNNSYHCTSCYQYFYCIERKVNENELRCNLCTDFPINNLVKCSKNHQYCKKCFDFITKNSYRHLVNLNDCAGCCEFLQQMKYKNLEKCEPSHISEYIQPKRYNSNPHSIKSSETKQEPEFILLKKQNSNIKFSPTPDPSEEPDLSRHNKPNISLIPKNSIKISSPEAKKTDSKSNISEKPTSSETGLIFKPMSPKKLIKHEKPTSLFKLSFNEICLEKSSPETIEISSPILRQSINLTIKCSRCNRTDNIKGYLCNHNLCIFCVNSMCLRDIVKFFQQYQVDPGIIKSEFSYKCIVEGCGKPLSVPTKMMITNHFKLMEDRNYRELMSEFLFLSCESVLPWVPYFDGLSSWMIFD